MEHYEVGRRIGFGASGSVHLVRDRRLADSRALCIKKIDLAACSKADQQSAQREVSVLKSLRHSGIVRYHDHFVDDSYLCIVQDYCLGGDLGIEIKRRAKSADHFGESEVLDLFVQVAEALDYVHGHRVLHRDLKTGNLFLDGAGNVLLGDFGIAKQLDGSAAATCVGTPYYLAPEMCRGERYAYKSDVWALGCILHELCCLRPTWQGQNILGVVYQIVEQQAPPLPPQYSGELAALVNALLTKSAAQRPSLHQVFNMPIVRRALERRRRKERESRETAVTAVTAVDAAFTKEGFVQDRIMPPPRYKQVASRKIMSLVLNKDAQVEAAVARGVPVITASPITPTSVVTVDLAPAALEGDRYDEPVVTVDLAPALEGDRYDEPAVAHQNSEPPVGSDEIQLDPAPYSPRRETISEIISPNPCLMGAMLGGPPTHDAQHGAQHGAQQGAQRRRASLLTYVSTLVPLRRGSKMVGNEGRVPSNGQTRCAMRDDAISAISAISETSETSAISSPKADRTAEYWRGVLQRRQSSVVAPACMQASGAPGSEGLSSDASEVRGCPSQPPLIARGGTPSLHMNFDALLADFEADEARHGMPLAAAHATSQATWCYLDRAKGEQGPVDEEMLLLLHACGDVDDHTLVWYERRAEWVPIAEVPGLLF